ISLQSATLRNANQWNVYSLDLSKLINAEQGAIYRVEISFKRVYSLYQCDAAQQASGSKDDDKDETSNEYERDNEDYYDYYDGEWNWSQRNNPCHDMYYRDVKITTNVLASDLGVIAKRGNNDYTIVVNDIITT